MLIVTTVQFRQKLKEILEKALSGEKIILKYYDKEFILKPTVKSGLSAVKKRRTKLSPQASKILADISDQEHKALAQKMNQMHQELYDLSTEEEKKFILNEKLRKYGI